MEGLVEGDCVQKDVYFTDLEIHFLLVVAASAEGGLRVIGQKQQGFVLVSSCLSFTEAALLPSF